MKSTKELAKNVQDDEVVGEKNVLGKYKSSTGVLKKAGIKKKSSGITLIALAISRKCVRPN